MQKLNTLVITLFLVFLQACSDSGSGTMPEVSGASATLPAIDVRKFSSGFNAPLQITHAGDGSNRLFIVEKSGTVRTIKNGTIESVVFLDNTSRTNSSGGEQGLLGIAFPPGFQTKRYFYINYTSQQGIGDTKIDRVPLSANNETANVTQAQTLLTIVQPFSNHNGGQMAFGPDGYLYIGVGDGGSGGDPMNNAQNLSTLLGKILRIDVEGGGVGYRIPTGNVFGNEIWSYGLRNPWRFSFDRDNGDLYIADVGQNLYEEIHFQDRTAAGGQNYGWRIMEGNHCFNTTNCNRTGLNIPVQEFTHSDGNCSVTGGYVYRGSLYPALQGAYIYGDFCSGRIWGLKRSGGVWESKLLADTNLRISTFGEDEEGNLYLADFNTGDIYQIIVP